MATNLTQIPASAPSEQLSVVLRKGTKLDCDAVMQLFKDTISTVNARDYNISQVNAWIAAGSDVDSWLKRMETQCFIVAEFAGTIVGFGSVSLHGYLDVLFVHKDHQAKGIARAILKDLERYCYKNQITEIWSDVSITARHFFSRHGFGVDRVYTKHVNDCNFENTIMRKFLVNGEIN